VNFTTSLIEAGLAIRSFEEFPHDASNTYAAFEQPYGKIPMRYVLV
jgi:hypothetical protein